MCLFQCKCHFILIWLNLQLHLTKLLQAIKLRNTNLPETKWGKAEKHVLLLKKFAWSQGTQHTEDEYRCYSLTHSTARWHNLTNREKSSYVPNINMQTKNLQWIHRRFTFSSKINQWNKSDGFKTTFYHGCALLNKDCKGWDEWQDAF